MAESDRESDEQKLKCDKPKIENKFADILRGYGIKENIISSFLKQDINFSDVAALDDEDLELMGVQDPATRAQLLSDFMKTRYQAKHFNRFLKKLDVNGYRETVYRNTAKHMLAVLCNLENLNLNLDMKPFTENYLVDDVYFTDLTLKAMKQTLAVVDTISVTEESSLRLKLLSALQNWKSIIVIGSIGATMAVFAFKWANK